MSFKIMKDGEHSATADTFDAAVSSAQVLLGFHKDVKTTYSIVDCAGKLLAAVTNRRITGTFTKQVWGGRKGNDAIHVEDVEFDATNYVLLMAHDELVALEDNRESTDCVGQAHVDWDGPHEVTVVESVCEYFGVGCITDITSEALAFARKFASLEPAREKVVTLMLKVRLNVAQGGSVDEFVRDLTCNLTSQTPGVKVAMVGQPVITKAD